MNNNIIIAIGFVLTLLILCIIWNQIMMKKYEKDTIHQSRFILETNVHEIDLTLCGQGIDKNTDNKFIDAVQKIDISEDVRVKIYD